MRVLGWLFVFIFTFVAGYYIGFDHGYEAKVAQNTHQEINVVGDAAQVMSDIIGLWRSKQDQKFTREIRDDGVVIDIYEGESTPSEGLWLVFTKDVPDESYKGPWEEGGVYFSMVMSETERLYFKVVRVTEQELELVFLDRGGALLFERVQ